MTRGSWIPIYGSKTGLNEAKPPHKQLEWDAHDVHVARSVCCIEKFTVAHVDVLYDGDQ